MSDQKILSPEEIQIAQDAYRLACLTFNRKLTKAEKEKIARAVVELAHVTNSVEALANRAIIRCL